MSPTPRITHDLVLTVGSAVTGLLLVKDEQGAPLFRVNDVSAFRPGISEGEAKYTDEPPEQQIPMVQTSWHAGFGAYEFENADPMRYAYAEGVDARFKGQMILGPLFTLKGIAVEQTTFGAGSPYLCDFNGTLCLGVGRYLYTYSYTNGYWSATTFDAGVGNAVTALCQYKTRLYIGLGDSVKYYYTADLSNFTQCTLADAYAHKFAVVPSDTDLQLWKALSTGELKSSTNPIIGGTWSAVQAQVGDTTANDVVRNLIVVRGMLVVLKDKAAYSFDAKGRQRVLFSAPQGMGTNFLASHVTFEGIRLYTSTGDYGLAEYDLGAVSDRHPQTFAPKIAQTKGMVGALTSDHAYLYAVLEAGPIYAGRYEVIEDSLRWVWHPLTGNFTGITTEAQAAIIHGSSSGRFLWVAFADITATVKKTGYLRLTDNHDNPKQDTSTNYRYASTGLLVTPWWDGGLPDRDKWLTRIKVWSQDVDSTHTLKVEYQLETDGASWTTITTWNTASDGVRTGAINTSGKRIRFRYTLTSSNNTTTPLVRSIVAYGRPHTQRLALIQFTVKAATGLRTLSGKQDPLSVATLKARLEAARDSTTGFTLSRRIRDQTAAESWTASILPGGFQEVEVYDHDRDGKVLAYSIIALECKTA